MNRSIYRNFYYVKESIADFLQCNRKQLFICIMMAILGFCIGLFVGLNNVSYYTIINLTDKTFLTFVTEHNWALLFIKCLFKYLLYLFIILFLCNFNALHFLNYLLFLYISFNIIFNTIIIAALCGFAGFLYAVLCYFIINILCLFLLFVIYLMCSSSALSCGCSNKFSSFPLKAIVLAFTIITVLLLIFCLFSSVFSNFLQVLI